MSAVAPYPHIEMHVRDDSIYIGLDTDILPLDMPIYIMRCQKGPIGKPMWCPTYQYATQIFGKDTFNVRSEKYWSEQSYFLLKTLVSNGAWIMRVAEEAAKEAKVYLELGVKKTDVPQWQRNSLTARFELDLEGKKTPINADGKPCEVVPEGDSRAGQDYYKTSKDDVIVTNKEYFARKYAKYNYTIVKETVALKDEVLYAGAGEVTVTGTYRSDQVTPEMRAESYIYFKDETGNYVPVPEEEPLDPNETYYTLSWSTYAGRVFEKNEQISEIGKWYHRAPNYAAGYEFKNLRDLHPEIENGDVVESDHSIRHLGDDGKFHYVCNEGPLYEVAGKIVAGELEPQANIEGIELVWRACLRSNGDDRADNEDTPSSSEGYDWYPAMSFLANSRGAWGGSFGFRFFYDKTNNTLAGAIQSGAVKYSFSPVELNEGETTPTAIVNAYGESVVTGTIREGVVDPTTDLNVDLKTLVPAQYSGSKELPCTMYFIPSNFQKVGKMVMEAELNAKQDIKSLYGDRTKGNCLDYWDKDEDGQPIIETFVDQLLGKDVSPDDVDECGYMTNVVSAIAPDGVPYFATCVTGTMSESGVVTPVADVVDLNSDSAFYLMGGTDGDISDYAIETYIRKQISAAIAGTQDYLIDYLRCPYNSVIDTGVSLETKKAYLDWMGVRDNLTVYLTPQQLWKKADGTTPPQLTRYEDESVGASLRSYGLLMREDIENATEANRCIIFLASGINSDHNYANNGMCASTLWVALKNAENYNQTFIKNELAELLQLRIQCYDGPDGGLTWTAASEETRARCWNEGLNYAQWADRKTIHYASVRSIYRYDTSVLCDVNTVRAVCFCKDIIRREWAIWAGSKRTAEELNSKITQALTDKVGAMLNSKYGLVVKVYQTDEDKKQGFVRHVQLEVTSPATNRVWISTIVCKRENFDPSAEAA